MFKTGFVQGLDGKEPSPLSGIGSATDIPAPGARPPPERPPRGFGGPEPRPKPVIVDKDPVSGKMLRSCAPIMPISSEELAAVKQMMASGPSGFSDDQVLAAGPFIHSFPYPGYNPAKHQVKLDDSLTHLVARPHYSW
jgi:hypothetical protein